MPCFKGLAVSIHTPDGPISEFSIQKQTRASRISSYIPVPPAKVPPTSTTGIPEQSTFAISITLLTPGLNVPYSTPKATIDDPYPRPRTVGGLPSSGIERGRYEPAIPPYIARTSNPNETIAAYIYFDGRTKEEVATLLRRGEETWVNSRWVSIPAAEGGGLAEREFIFREVGLERWLNGLDLEGSKDKAERIERRQRKLEKQQRKKTGPKIKLEPHIETDQDEEMDSKSDDRNGVLRYRGSGDSPVEDISNEDGHLSTDSDTDDEPPQPEAAGQIKVALFRVLASGEIKRGEYSPQFDAHEGDEDMDQSGDGEVDHTTSFAKPKTLDPKTISTQTVTGLDPPESPYAVFTFFYRGEKQLQKMGILPTADVKETPRPNRRKSAGPDFSKLGPLKSYGTVGFSGYRDPAKTKRKTKSRNKDDDVMDSDADDDDAGRSANGAEDDDLKHVTGATLSPEDARRQGEIADGVQRIKLKRVHSAEPLNEATATRKSPHRKTEDTPPVGTPQSVNSLSANAGTPPDGTSPPNIEANEVIGSPFKRHRGSMAGLGDSVFSLTGTVGDTVDSASKTHSNQAPADSHSTSSMPEVKLDSKADSDEELPQRVHGKRVKIFDFIDTSHDYRDPAGDENEADRQSSGFDDNEASHQSSYDDDEADGQLSADDDDDDDNDDEGEANVLIEDELCFILGGITL